MIAAIANLLLALRIASIYPPVVAPLDHVRAAAASSGPDVPAEVLLALAYFESRFEPTAVSRLEGGRRTGGVWPSTAPAGRGPWYCGVTQTAAELDWSACLALRDLERSYRLGAIHLRNWLRATRGNLRAALNGYACGWAGLEHGCGGYGEAVLWMAARFRGRP